VASGEPLPDSVMIWTRLAPDPLNNGGMPQKPVTLRWEVAVDDKMRDVVQRGKVTAQPEFAHSVHVEVAGLKPHHWYWYRFDVGGKASSVGRTRTAPALGQQLDRFRFAFAACQNYQAGYYTAYRHMAGEELDLVVHLGDYIYETKPKRWSRPRRHNSYEVDTLAEYRNRYALYKLDPDLQAAHAAFPWCVVPDDHEVDNDYANDKEEKHRMTPAAFRVRRAAAYRAYFEHMPFRTSQFPRGSDMQLYRSLPAGDLIDFHFLDTRQYRTDQQCGRRWEQRCEAAMDPRATILGTAQEKWLYARLNWVRAKWTVLAQQVPMMERMREMDGDKFYNVDKWDGYVAARKRLLDVVKNSQKQGLVVLSGDVHAAWAGTLKADFKDPKSRTLGTEFVGTSISSSGDGWGMKKGHRRTLDANPHLEFYNGRRGYARCDVTPSVWRTDYRVLPYVTRPGAPIKTRASFTVARKQPGLMRK